MVLNLKSEIDRLNNNKEKTKRAATNIDNKLVELGGERATDLADVPNKIGSMIRENYKKIAIIDVSGDVSLWTKKETSIKVNVDFTPSRLFIRLQNKYPEIGPKRKAVIDSTEGYIIISPAGGYMNRLEPNQINFDNATKTLKMCPEFFEYEPRLVDQIIAIE